MEPTELKKILWDMGRILTADISAILEPTVKEHGLTMMQLRFLLEIEAEGPTTVGSLSHIVGENSGNCSSMCKKLESAGFLIRKRCPEDERRVRLTLTDQGEAFLQELSDHTKNHFLALKQEIPEEELEDIFNGIRRLTDAIHRLSQPTEEEQSL